MPAPGSRENFAVNGYTLVKFLLKVTSVCKISGVSSGSKFGMVQGGRGEDIHVRAATIPSPVLGLEKGDRERFGLAGLYMGQVRHMFFRAQSQKVQLIMMSGMGCLSGQCVQYGYCGHFLGV